GSGGACHTCSALDLRSLFRLVGQQDPPLSPSRPKQARDVSTPPADRECHFCENWFGGIAAVSPPPARAIRAVRPVCCTAGRRKCRQWKRGRSAEAPRGGLTTAWRSGLLSAAGEARRP